MTNLNIQTIVKSFDPQTQVDANSGRIDHWASAKKNLESSFGAELIEVDDVSDATILTATDAGRSSGLIQAASGVAIIIGAPMVAIVGQSPLHLFTAIGAGALQFATGIVRAGKDLGDASLHALAGTIEYSLSLNMEED